MTKASHIGSVETVKLKASVAGNEEKPSDSDYLHLLGDAVRAARARRGMTRKMLARHSGVSERFLAQLESGAGNASVLILRQVAQALGVPLEAMLPGSNGRSAELAHAVELLQRLDPAELAQACELLQQQFGVKEDVNARHERIALIGLRGAGKSTIGKLLGKKLDLPFFELDRLVEEASGVSLSMIFDLYGQSGFRRFERRCLEDLLSAQAKFVLATGGSLVSEPATYERLLATSYTIWLRATPQEHMTRVVAQGDMRPMANNPAAMSDLERILAEREDLYRRADLTIETSHRPIDEVLTDCLQSLGANLLSAVQ
ncbi:MAG TPA: helix-turn-helix transcriptional regulator [Terriglobales bacterium]|jgi:XRE family aerobic/anaerobic benzoate catabolism transcriptional regulator|nr:helix-turn-helix transcriptional regulator [Terriglobales bacterium]